MPLFRKKPVVIEARRFVVSSVMQAEMMAAWCGGLVRGIKLPIPAIEIEIPTLEGAMRAQQGDYIIKGVKGEFYPCKPDIFEATYEAVEQTHSP